MKKKILSIIIPVYNASKYIEKCLDSFAFNLLEDSQIIIVDDCSSDDSFNKVEKYIEKNNINNILLMKNETNIGAGLTKNRALDFVEGEYVGFIDSDDFVCEGYFSNMLDLAKKTGSDIVVSDIALTYEDSEEKHDIFHNNLYKSTDNGETEVSKELLFGHWACVSTCNKIFKSSLIKNIRFSDKKSDDIIFTIKAIIGAEMISYCRDNYYYYYQSVNSLTRNSSYEKYEESMECLFNAINVLYDYDVECAKIYSANALFPHICYTLKDINILDVQKFLGVVKKGFSDCQDSMELFKNSYLKKNALYNSSLYRKILNYVKNSKYEEVISLLNEKERLPERNVVKLRKLDEKFNPLVSIIIPVYNGENYLEEAIESALSQTYKNIEVLVVDDGSKDRTEEICRRYGKKIKYIRKDNGGVATALNVGVENMEGEYFSWLSHDDLYFEDKVERQVAFLSTLEDKNVVLFGNYILINENGRRIGEPVIINHKMIEEKPEYTLLRGSVNGITVLIPKFMLEKYKFDENLRCTQDYDLWHKLLKEYKFIHMEDVLSKTRIHSLQDSIVSPRVVSEGEKLWTYMINDLSDERKISLEGTIYDFYYKMAEHLKISPYVDTCNMCIEKCKEIDEVRYNKNPIFESKKKNYISKVIYCLRNYGFIQTLKIIINKLKG